MGTLKDVWDFEGVNFGNIWKQIKDDPERLLYGSIDPFSTELWNTILGEDEEPMINQLGGPMGSGWSGLGENGGVYDMAREKGINTEWSEKSHDVAEVIAAIYGAAGAGDALGGLFGGGGEGAAAGGGEAASAGGDGIMGMGDITQGWDAQNAANLQETLGGGAFEMPSVGGAGFNWQDLLDQQQSGGGQQQQQQSEPKKNAYEEFMENQRKAQLVAQALAEPQRNQAPNDYGQQVAAQKRRRMVAQAMMG